MSMPQCFGEFWDGVTEQFCKDCQVNADCLATFVSGKLVELVKVHGEDAAVISDEAGCSQGAVEYALAEMKRVQKNVEEPVQKSEEPVEEPQESVPEAVEEEEETPPEEKEVAAEPEKEAAPEKSEPKKKAATKKDTKKKAPKKEAAKKKPPKKAAGKKKGAPKADPQKAGSAKPALDPEQTKKAVSVKTAKGRGDRRLDPEEKFKRAFTRERERLEEKGIELRPGMKLEAIWKKGKPEEKVVQVQIRKNGYMWEGELRPTLYSISKEVTGTTQCPKQKRGENRPDGTRSLTCWNAIKFFRLRTLFPAAKKKAPAKKKKS